MSAFLVSEKHINSIMNFAVYKHNISFELAQKRGQILWSENRKSVNSRYREKKRYPVYEYNFDYDKIIRNPIQIMKLIDCLIYQSCEHKKWDKSEAKSYLELLRHQASTSIIGYDDLEWEV